MCMCCIKPINKDTGCLKKNCTLKQIESIFRMVKYNNAMFSYTFI